MCDLACFSGVVIYSDLGRQRVFAGGLAMGVDCRLVGRVIIRVFCAGLGVFWGKKFCAGFTGVFHIWFRWCNISEMLIALRCGVGVVVKFLRRSSLESCSDLLFRAVDLLVSLSPCQFVWRVGGRGWG